MKPKQRLTLYGIIIFFIIIVYCLAYMFQQAMAPPIIYPIDDKVLLKIGRLCDTKSPPICSIEIKETSKILSSNETKEMLHLLSPIKLIKNYPLEKIGDWDGKITIQYNNVPDTINFKYTQTSLVVLWNDNFYECGKIESFKTFINNLQVHK